MRANGYVQASTLQALDGAVAKKNAPEPTAVAPAPAPAQNDADKKISDEMRKKTRQDPKKLQTDALNEGAGPIGLPALRERLIQQGRMKEGSSYGHEPKSVPMKVMDEVLVRDPRGCLARYSAEIHR